MLLFKISNHIIVMTYLCLDQWNLVKKHCKAYSQILLRSCNIFLQNHFKITKIYTRTSGCKNLDGLKNEIIKSTDTLTILRLSAEKLIRCQDALPKILNTLAIGFLFPAAGHTLDFRKCHIVKLEISSNFNFIINSSQIPFVKKLSLKNVMLNVEEHNFPKLTSLEILKWVDIFKINILVHYFKTLKSLKILNCNKIHDDFYFVLSDLYYLKFLTLENYEGDIPKLTFLKTLNLNESSTNLIAAPNLQYITLEGHKSNVKIKSICLKKLSWWGEDIKVSYLQEPVKTTLDDEYMLFGFGYIIEF